MEKKEQQLQIDLDSEVAKGTYANISIIAHSHSEFILDFVRVMPGMPKGTVVSRVIMTPENAKSLLTALQNNIGTFEKQNGSIKKENSPFPVIGFGGGEA